MGKKQEYRIEYSSCSQTAKDPFLDFFDVRVRKSDPKIKLGRAAASCTRAVAYTYVRTFVPIRFSLPGSRCFAVLETLKMYTSVRPSVRTNKYTLRPLSELNLPIVLLALSCKKVDQRAMENEW